MLKTEAITLPGDSGGVVYNGLGRVVGIIKGSNHGGVIDEMKTEYTFEYNFIVKAANIFDSFSAYNCSITS